MKITILFISALISILMVTSTFGEEETSGTWTMSTGVQLKKITECSEKNTERQLTIKKIGKTIQVKLRDFFPCDETIEKPWLTLENNKKATLVIVTKQPFLSWANSCECMKELIIDISRKIESGTTLYILNNREVVGHEKMP